MNNLPNIITLLRLPFTVLFFVCFVWGTHSATLTFVSLVFLLLAGLSDAVDGWLARRLRAESGFGRFFDPLMDKVLICGGYIILLELPYVARWMVIVILTRELLVTALRALVEAEGVKFGANIWGKAKMVIQWVALVVIVAVEGYARMESVGPVSRLIPTIAIWIATVVTVGSGVSYILQAQPVLRKQWSARG